MKAICFYFQVHQPFRLKKYRFFQIGNDHKYYDEFANRTIMEKVANKCYLPTNNLLLKLIAEYGQKFKISFSISGTALDQFEKYAPKVLESFKKLAETGCVEFLSETYSHSLSSLSDSDEFYNQIREHDEKLKELLNVKPTVFRNTELIYSDTIGEKIANLGYKAILTEGAKHILGWRSPNFVYCNAINPRLKVLLKNYTLSDDIAFRFSNHDWEQWPLTTEKFASWINALPKEDDIINLFMDYETFGEHQWEETGIFNFLDALPKAIFSKTNFSFMTPSEVIDNFQPISSINVPNTISWADEERDLTAWLGNELQDDAFKNLYNLSEKMKKCTALDLLQDWNYLQTSDHFYYMCTKWFSDGDVHKYFNPYETPYAAFINYMNILTDFTIRLDKHIAQTGKEKTKEDFAVLFETLDNDKKKKLINDMLKYSNTEIKKDKNQVSIENLKNFSDTKIKKILKECTIKQLVYSLKGVSPLIKEKIVKNLGKRILKEINYKLENLGAIRLIDIEKMQSKIIAKMKKYI